MAGDSKDRWRTDVLYLLRNLESKVTQLEANSRSSPSEVLQQLRREDEKVSCQVKCVVKSIGEIDTVKQTFEAEVRLRFRWREEKFQGRRLQDIALDEYWNPRIYFPNAVTINERERTNFIHYYDGENVPYAFLSIIMKAIFKTTMKLEDFPLDYQALTIKVMSSWPEDKMEFKQDDKEKNIINPVSFTEKHEWTLYKGLIVGPEEDEETNGYPMHVIKIYVERKTSYYMWNVAFVTLLILLANFTSFAVTASAPEDRLSVSVTLLLTAVAFKSVVSSTLPKIPYLTFMDKYVLWSLSLQCFVVLQNAIAVIFARRTEISHYFDYGSIALLIVAVIALNVYFIDKLLSRELSAFRKLPRPSDRTDEPLILKGPEVLTVYQEVREETRMAACLGRTDPVHCEVMEIQKMDPVHCDVKEMQEMMDDNEVRPSDCEDEFPAATEEDKMV